MTKNMKRIHKVTIRYYDDDPQPANEIGIKAEADVSFPLSEMHTAKCIEINDKRAAYHCECSSKDSLIQHLTSGGLWGIAFDSDAKYLEEIEAEQLAELRNILHQIGFSNRAISAAFKNVQRIS